jgi:hypothetical protein
MRGDEKSSEAERPTEQQPEPVASGPKQPSGAQVFVADGAGGMRPVDDLRFEEGEWPIDRVVPADRAGSWMAHLHAEIEARGWNASSFSQLHAAENSGTISVHTATGASPPGLDIVYERVRDAGLHVRARPAGEPLLPIDEAEEFLARVGERLDADEADRGHRREFLSYDGLAWRGELWLGADLRLGPPSKFPEALSGRQVVVVDAMVEGIGPQGITANFQIRVHELVIFLGFLLGVRLTPVRWRQEWVPEVDADGRIEDCTLRSVGYSELSPVPGSPEVGIAEPVERRDVARPGLGQLGIGPDMQEQWVPSDIEDLWAIFVSLDSAKREQLMRAGNAYLIAGSMWPDQRTAYATFLVVACESLKPTGKRNNRKNIYDVVRSLLGQTTADRLRRLPIPPQLVRHGLVHRGELRADELGPMLIHDYFMDPSFDETLQELATVARTCMIEWLRAERQRREG